MIRLPVTVVLVAQPGVTLRCLDSLRATLGPRDEIVLVTGDPASLRGLASRVRAVPAEASASLADCRELGRRHARSEVVVFLDDDTLLPAHWLDPLVAALADVTVAAAGPRSNRMAGVQFVPDAHYEGRRAAVNEFARAWRQENRGRTTETDELSPVCVAVRRDASATATRQLVVHESYVHHEAGDDCALLPPRQRDPSAPLLSASLIVKDEEDVLERCLAPLLELCDEVVVYDTGSSDRTREIARAAGAVVVEGYWDDSFGDARNRSLDSCTGEWALVVDADEVVLADVAATRAALEATSGEAFTVRVHNTTGLGTGAVVDLTSCRIFRRRMACYSGRIHEQVVHRVLGRAVRLEPLPSVRLEHSGYEQARFLKRNKGERNLRLSEVALSDTATEGTLGRDIALANLGRSQIAAGQLEAAMKTFDEMAQLTVFQPLSMRAAGKTAVNTAVALRRIDDAWAWVERVRATGETPERVEACAAEVLAGEGRFQDALERLQALPEEVVDEGGLSSFRRLEHVTLEVKLLMALGRAEEAVAPLLAALQANTLDLHLAEQVEVFVASGAPLVELARAYSDQSLPAAMAQACELLPEISAVVLEAFWKERQEHLVVLVTAAALGRRLPVRAADEWSARLRQAGLGARCPLVAIAAEDERSAHDRLLAAGVAVEKYDDERALPLLYIAADEVPEAEAQAALEELRLVAPRVAEAMEVAPA
ncbi:MAG: glycosyltransferase [Actinomycetota bacterium]|nr:glycosyltransferase [Actinomycetota bacterium]